MYGGFQICRTNCHWEATVVQELYEFCNLLHTTLPSDRYSQLTKSFPFWEGHQFMPIVKIKFGFSLAPYESKAHTLLCMSPSDFWTLLANVSPAQQRTWAPKIIYFLHIFASSVKNSSPDVISTIFSAVRTETRKTAGEFYNYLRRVQKI